jgi:L-aspartate oxidase
LRNFELLRFMPKYHELAELAPRDVVARAIVHEMELTRGKDPFVYLDLTHLPAEHLKRRFPRIYATCLEYNIDITSDLIPTRPAAHYAMGGVRTDLDGRTSVPHLYAAGETAATGVHGANRLASNSLLEGLVFGARAGNRMRNELRAAPARESNHVNSTRAKLDADVEAVLEQIQDRMWRDVGIVRDATGLRRAISQLEQLAPKMAHAQDRRAHEVQNVHQVGLLIARSALAREESRGAHYRTDFPAHEDGKFLKHSIVKGDCIRFE